MKAQGSDLGRKSSYRQRLVREQARRQRLAQAELLERRDATGSMLLSLPGLLSLSPLAGNTSKGHFAGTAVQRPMGHGEGHQEPLAGIASGEHNRHARNAQLPHRPVRVGPSVQPSRIAAANDWFHSTQAGALVASSNSAGAGVLHVGYEPFDWSFLSSDQSASDARHKSRAVEPPAPSGGSGGGSGGGGGSNRNDSSGGGGGGGNLFLGSIPQPLGGEGEPGSAASPSAAAVSNHATTPGSVAGSAQTSVTAAEPALASSTSGLSPMSSTASDGKTEASSAASSPATPNASTSVNTTPAASLHLGFRNGLSDWHVGEAGGSGANKGSVQAGSAILREGNSFLVTASHDFIVPVDAQLLNFTYANLSFDTTDVDSINDAFEAALVDDEGVSLVNTFATGRDSFLNFTEEQPAALATGVVDDGGNVSLDISAVAPGTHAIVVFRLVNNDQDENTTVTIKSVDVVGSDTPPIVTVALANDTAPTGPGTDAYRADKLTNDASVAGTVSDDLGINLLEAQIDNGAFQNITSSLTGEQYEFDPGSLPAGPHRITIRATDTAAHTTDALIDFLVNQPPVARAGGNLTLNEGETATFDGSQSSDDEGPLFAQSWAFDGGAPIAGGVASRTYAQNGLFSATHTVVDTAGSVASDRIQITVENLAPEIVSADNPSGVEGRLIDFSASFGDAGRLDTHSATIDWGDGTIEPAPVDEQNGAGVAQGHHFYADDGQYHGTLVVRDGDGGVSSTGFTANISNAGPQILSAPDLTGNEGQSVSFAATFRDDGSFDRHTALIHWGDGATTAGIVTESHGTGSVAGQHVYADNGSYPVRLELFDNAGGADARDASATMANVAPIVAPAADQTPGEGAPLNLVVGGFSDPGFTSASAGTVESFTATIDWGDDSPLDAGAVSVTAGSAGTPTQGTVSGTHTYSDNGQYTVTMLVRDDDGGVGMGTFHVNAANRPPVILRADPIFGKEGQPLSFFGTFRDDGAQDTHSAVINWGDGSPIQAALVDEANGLGTATAQHVYANDGQYTGTLTVQDADGGVATTHFTATIGNTAPQIESVADIFGDEGQERAFYAIFQDDGAHDTHSATIRWGDGTSSAGEISGSGAMREVSARHVYADNGLYSLALVVADEAGATATATAKATIGNVPPSVTPVADQSVSPGVQLTTTLATLSDPGFSSPTAGTVETFAATIDWGDGSPLDSGTVITTVGSAGVPSHGSVSGRHTYGATGQYTVTVRVADDDSGIGQAMLHVNVAGGPPQVNVAPLPGNEGQQIDVLATFTDQDPADTHTATVHWGDGTHSEAIVVDHGGSGTITAHHTYNDNGSYAVRVEVLDQNQGLGVGETIAAISNVAPAASIVGPSQGLPGQLLSFTLAASDVSPADQAAGFSFSIAWGDGTPVETIAATPGDGGGTTVSHVFHALGTYTPLLRATDKDGGVSNAVSPVNVLTVSASIYVLAATGSGTLSLSGNGNLTTGGSVIVDSNSSTALMASGNAALTASRIQVVGSYHATGNATFYPQPITAAPVVPDPLANLAAPSRGVARGSLNLSGNYAQTISPGIYTQITVSGNAQLTLNPGVYILKGGGLSVSGNARLSGTGVTFYNAGGNFPSAGGSFGSISISGNGVFNLAAPTSGPYAGIMVFQARDNARPLSFSGNAVGGMSGTIYAKAAPLSLTGNGTLRDALVVDRLGFSGNGSAPFSPGADGEGSSSPSGDIAGTKFFVVDPGADQTFRYSAAGASLGNFAVDAAAVEARGVASNAAGDTLWIIDANTRRVVVQGPDGTLRGSWLAEGLTSPQDIATDGRDIWIVDAGKHQVLSYLNTATLRSGSATPSSIFDLDTANGSPTGVVTDGQRLWVTDDARDQVFVYSLSGSLLGRWSLDGKNSDASGITLNSAGGNDLWVVDRVDRQVYRYGTGRTLTAGTAAAASTFSLVSANRSPEGIADPPTLGISDPPANTSLSAGQTLVLTGQVLDDNGPASSVKVNGQAVDVLDQGGNFFQKVQVAPGENVYSIEATDAAGASATTNLAVTGTQLAAGAIDFAHLSVVSGSTFGFYGRTSWQDARNVLDAEFGLHNTGQYAVNGPILVGVTNISDPSVRLREPTGITPDGIPYFDMTALVSGASLSPGESSGLQSISFFAPSRARFTYDLVFFAGVNEAPRITTVPDVEAIASHPYVYDADAVDLNGDALTFSLESAPDGMQTAPDTGRITWTPASSDIGTHSVIVAVDDGHGGSTQQRYVLSAIASPPNRPPVFTSLPFVAAEVNTAYRYQSQARDADDDSLTFSLIGGPAGLAVEASSGLVTWTPADNQVGIQNVMLQVSDGRGGTATQSFSIRLGQEPGNTAPVIISEPVQNFDVADLPNPATGDVTPTQIDLDLAAGESATQTVSLALASMGPNQSFADIVFAVDESTSMEGEQAWLGTMVFDLDAALQARGIGPNRYSLVGFGGINNRFPAHPFNLIDTSTLSMFGPTSSTIVGSQALGPVLPLAAFEATASTSGEQLVLVSDTSNRPGGYRFHVVAPSTTTVPLALGSLISGSLDVPGEKDRYTFTVTQPTQVYFDSLTNRSDIKWTLTGPTGAVASNLPFTNSDSRFSPGHPAMNLLPGDYALTITGSVVINGLNNSSVTGPYQFRLSDLTSATPLTPDTPITSGLNPANETDIYRFTAAAGDRYYFDFVSGSATGDPLWRLVDPYGNVLFTKEFRSPTDADVETLTLAHPGAYTLFIEGGVADTIASTYTINVQPVSISTAPLVLGDTTSGAIGVAGEQDRFTFTLPAAALLDFDSLANNTQINWTLSGPSGTVVSNRQFSNSDGSLFANPVVSAVAGDYTLTVDGVGAATNAYSFRLNDLAAAGAILPGTAVSGSLNPANETDLYSFSAQANDRFSFDAQARTNGGSAFWRLVDPFGNSLFNNPFRNTSDDVGTITLGQPGRYTLLLEGGVADTGSGTYTFSVVPQGTATPTTPPSSTPLTLGNTVSDAISAAGERDNYTFSLASASLLYFDSLTNNGNLNWTLVGPAGTAVSARSFTASDGGGSLGGTPALNLVAGAYLLTVAGNGASTGSYSFRLSQMSQASPLSPGTPVSGDWNPGAETDLYKFSASAGDRFYFDVQASSFQGALSAHWQLIDPYGNSVFSNTFGNAASLEADLPTLNQTGTYTLLIEGPILASSTGTYTFNVQPVTIATTPLTLGTRFADAIATAGERDVYTFSLSSDSKLYFDSQTNNGNLTWTLTGPAGAAVTGRPFNSDATLASPLPAGDYTLTIDGTGDQVGAYAFRLSDLASATPLIPGTPVSGDWNPGNETDLYQFSASAGDRIYFDVQTSSFQGAAAAHWQLIDPYGNVVFNNFFVNTAGIEPDSPTLTLTGTYTLLVEGNIIATTPGSYSFNVQPVTITTTPLTLGSPVTSAIATAGEQDVYTVTLPSAALLGFDSLTNSTLTWSLSGPTGTVVSGRALNASDGFNVTNPVLNLPAGDYTLTVDGTGDASGNYSFRFSDLAAATPFTPGTPVSGAFGLANETDLYRFNAAAGDRFYFDTQARTGAPSARWRLIDPFGAVLFQSAFSAANTDVDTLTLNTGGTYTLLLEGAIGDSAPGTYTFNVQPVSNATQPLTLGATVTNAIAVTGEQDRYTFSLAATSLLYFDSQTNSGSVNWTLSGPAGIAVNARSFSDGETNNPILNLPAGDYTFTIDGTLDTTTPYVFRLSQLSSASAFTPAAPVSGSLSPGNESDLYAFTAAAGDQLFFDQQGRTGNGARWRLIDPFGNVLFNTSFDGPSNDVDTLTITQAGTYTLLVEGVLAATAPGTYTFNVQPVTIATQPLTLGSMISSAIAVPGEQDRYTFSLGTASLLYFDSLTNNVNLNWTLTGPAGTPVTNRALNNGETNNPLLNLVAGNYTLTIDGNIDATGPYSFRLSELSSATVITPGTPVSGSLNPANETDLFSFSASANDRYSFDVQSRTNGGSSRWRLADPLGNILFSSGFNSTSSDVATTTLTQSGRYTLLLEGAIGDTLSGDYTFAVVPQGAATPATPPASTPLTLGGSVSDSISAAGEQDNYRFSLASSSFLYFDSRTNNGSLNWTLTGPAGVAVSARNFASSDSVNVGVNPVISVPAGDYVLTVAATGSNTGNYSFTLSELSSATALTPGTPISGSLDPASETDLYRFTATAGDRFYFDTLARTNAGNARWRLVDPFGNILFFNFFTGGDVDVVTAPQTGVYTLLLEGSVADTTPGSYTINVQPAPGSTAPLTLGSLTNGVLATPGDHDRYTFSLPGAALVYFDALTNNGNLTWSLTGPAGTPISGRNFTSSDSVNVGGNPVISLPAGNYTLTVDGNNDATGAYAFRLSDLSSATSIIPGTPFSGSLDPGNETDLYRFAASAGEPFYFDSVARSGAPSGQWRLVDPYGNIVFSNRYDAASTIEPDVLTLPQAGNYTLLLEGHAANTVSGSYTVNVQPVSFSSQPLTLNAPLHAALSVAGEQDDYTFTGATGQRIFFDGLQSATRINATLLAPSGNTVFTAAVGTNSGPLFLPESGTYRLNIDGNGDAVGAYGFELYDVASTPTPEANGDISGVLDQTLGSDLFRVDIPAGQNLVFEPGNDLFIGTAQQLSTATHSLTANGNTEDGYQAIATGLGLDSFRPGAAANLVLITDEDRDIVDPAQNFGSIFSALDSRDVLLNGVHDALLQDGSNRVALGVDSNGTAYIADGAGGFTTATGGKFVGTVRANQTTKADYLDLAWGLGGAAWDLNQLRAGGLAAASFSKAFVAIKAREVEQELKLELVPSAANTGFENLTGVVSGVRPGESVSFDAKFTGNGSPQSFDLLFRRPGANVVLGSIPVTINVGDYVYPVQAIDADGDPITFSLVEVPTGATIDPASGRITWAPPAAGDYRFVVEAADGRGGRDVQDYEVHVTSGAPNQPPTIRSTAPTQATAGLPFAYDVAATDPDGDLLSYFLTQAPSGMAIDQTTGRITWTPTQVQIGSQNVVVRVFDGRGGEATQTFTLSVVADTGNHPPKIVSVPIVVAGVGELYRYEAAATDADGDAFSFDVVVVPTGLTVDGQSGVIAWRPTAADVGQQHVVLRVRDGRGGVDLQSYQITVNAVGTAPCFSTPPPTAKAIVGHPYQYRFLTQDAEGQRVTYRLNAGPDNMTIDQATGLLNWTPGADQVGAHDVVVSATDSGGAHTELAFTLEVLAVASNDAPIITSTPRSSIGLGATYRYQVAASDPNNDPLTITLPTAPLGMTISADGLIRWDVAPGQLGDYAVSLRVADGRGGVATQTFTVNVTSDLRNRSPGIVSTPLLAATIDREYAYNLRGVDPDNDPLFWSLTTFPRGMSINPTLGTLCWMPAADQMGANDVVVRLDDGQGGVATQSFTIIVRAANLPPLITSTPPTQGAVAQPYTYAVQAIDGNGDSLANVANCVDSATGQVSWWRAEGNADDARDGNDGALESGVIFAGGKVGQAFSFDGSDYVAVPDNANLRPAQFTLEAWINPASTIGFDSVVAKGATGQTPGYHGDANAYWLGLADGKPRFYTGHVSVLDDFITGATALTPGQWHHLAATFDGTTKRLYADGVLVASGMVASPIRYDDFPVPLTIGEDWVNGAASGQYAFHGLIDEAAFYTRALTTGEIEAVYNADVAGQCVDAGHAGFRLTTSPAGMTIDSATGQISWTPTAPQVGPNHVNAVVSDGHGGSAMQSFTVVVAPAPPNQPPTITTVPIFLATADGSYSYDADATDPEQDALTFALTSAPAGMAIDSGSGAIAWTPTAAQLGSQRVTLTVSDSAGNIASQRYSIFVQAANRPPIISSSPVLSTTAGVVYRYDLKASDPDGNALSYKLLAAPSGMSIDALGRITWTTGIADIGSQHVSVLVADTLGASVSQSFDVAVSADTELPRVVLDVSPSPAEVGSEVTIFVSATDNVGIADLLLTVAGQPLVVDADGLAIYEADHVGAFAVVVQVRDAAGNEQTASDTLDVIDTSDVDAPRVVLTSPDDGAIVRAPTEVRGTVSDDNLVQYTLSVAPLGSPQFTELARGTSSVIDGLLGTFDPTLLLNDVYVIRLEAIDAGGNVSTLEREINVADDLKLGNFRLSFTDLTVPVFGVPITVTRTYDTLTATQTSDFGIGWRLEFRNMNLRTSVAPTGREEYGIFNSLKVGSRVYVTLPGGERQAFTFQPTVASGIRGAFLGIFEPNFVPDAGVKSSLTVTPADLRINTDGRVFDYATGLPYNPASSAFGGSYLLTTKAGLAFDINGRTGELTALSDPTNNTLKFSDAGITGPDGKSIAFERDPRGRITAVVDPAGQRMQYRYDARGDLIAVSDRTSNTTHFEYRTTPAHYLDKVIDPLGHTGVRTEYDAQGRLSKVLDAVGNPVQISYDPTQLLNTVTDPLGNTTTDVYDERGNTLRHIDALGGSTLRTFDADNNKLTETDPLGRTTTFTYDDRGDVLTQTDSLGNTIISSYQAFSYGTTALAASRGEAAAPFTLVKTSTDALGNTTAFQYTADRGDLLSATDPAGHVTNLVYDRFGRPPSALVDANGNVKQFETVSGLLVRQMDALGHVTTFTYDANGNQLTSTTTQTRADGTVRTLTTSTVYDAEGRVLAVTDSEGGVTRTEYDAAGNKVASIDALGRRTEYRYDYRNKLIETILSDDTPADLSDNPRTQIEYDAAGHETARIDELGRRTKFEYDAGGRQTKTVFPDNSLTRTEYDGAGQVTAEVDARGNRTEFEYDADGHRTVTRDAAGQTTTYTYDGAGRLIAQTDPLQHTTRYAFDASSLLIETRYPDGTKTTSSYDAGQREIARTDELNRTTRFEYDAVDRLTAVVDALNQRTEYTYDEVGNLIGQKNASGQVTRYEYDGLAHRTATVLPLGQRSRTSYDAAGNVEATKDFNGATITLGYDARNRLAAKSFPDGTSVAYAYTLTGQLSTVTDSRGTTSYDYDLSDRLLSHIDPDGAQVSYTYDAAGNRTSLTAAVGGTSLTTTYTFDMLNRLETVTGPDLGVTRYTYDAASNLTRTELPNGTVETRSYDDLNRLQFLENRGPSGVISSYRYVLSATGQRDSVVEQDGRRVEYTYDGLDRLTHEAITDAALGDRTFDYTYDAVGNRLTRNDSSEGLTRYSYDANDRLLSETLAGEVTRYTYDNNGNMLSRASATDSVFYNWDFENRLIAVDTDGDGTMDVRNAYNDNGIRVSQTVGSQQTRFLIDTLQPFAQVLLEYRPSGLITASYVYGNRLISQTGGDATSFYHIDGLGSTRMLTDGSGSITDRYIYEAFGRILTHVGSSPNAYLFAGQQLDSTLGYYYLRARYLNAEVGRFVSSDPREGVLTQPRTLHRYVYADGNPVNRTDPSGLFTILETGAILNLLALQVAEPVVELSLTVARVIYANKFLQPAFELQFAALTAQDVPATLAYESLKVARVAQALGYGSIAYFLAISLVKIPHAPVANVIVNVGLTTAVDYLLTIPAMRSLAKAARMIADQIKHDQANSSPLLVHALKSAADTWDTICALPGSDVGIPYPKSICGLE